MGYGTGLVRFEVFCPSSVLVAKGEAGHGYGMGRRVSYLPSRRTGYDVNMGSGGGRRGFFFFFPFYLVGFDCILLLLTNTIPMDSWFR